MYELVFGWTSFFSFLLIFPRKWMHKVFTCCAWSQQHITIKWLQDAFSLEIQKVQENLVQNIETTDENLTINNSYRLITQTVEICGKWTSSYLSIDCCTHVLWKLAFILPFISDSTWCKTPQKYLIYTQ